MDALEYHDKFRAITGEYVRDMLRDHPGECERRWVCRCYQSREEFERLFPTSSERREILERLDAVRVSIDEAAFRGMRKFHRLEHRVSPIADDWSQG